MKIIKYLTFLFLIGCNKNTCLENQLRYHTDGLAKPKVALIKVIDTSSHDLSWDISAEFTELLMENLLSRSKFYLTDDFHMIGKKQLKQLNLSPYSEDMRWLLEMNSSSEFVIFTEILKHSIETKKDKTYNPFSHIKTLNLSLRVCALDIRKKNPKIILQEIITEKYSIPFNFGSYKENSSPIAKNTFNLSPLGVAHKNILSKVTKEIEDYILLAQSNIYD
jgi:hypothetical protein